jgi:cyclohexanone monooxygenase
MTCNVSDCPTVASIDIPALREKYSHARTIQINKAGQEKYIRPANGFSDVYKGDPHMPVLPHPPLVEDIDVAVLGGGWAGKGNLEGLTLG